MNALRALARLLHALGHCLAGWWTITFEFPKLDARTRELRVQAWARRALEILAIGFEVRGTPIAHGPALLVINHISWLDILVLHAARFCRFVSKSEIKGWPLLGSLATGAGTLYIERAKRRDAMRVVHGMADSLRAGDVVAIFPEGTTTDARRLLPFHANLIQAAVSSGAPVQPVAMRFVDDATGDDSPGPLYINDDTLIGSLWRSAAGPRYTAIVQYGEPQAAEGRDRRAWAKDLHAAVQDLRRQLGAPDQAG